MGPTLLAFQIKRAASQNVFQKSPGLEETLCNERTYVELVLAPDSQNFLNFGPTLCCTGTIGCYSEQKKDGGSPALAPEYLGLSHTFKLEFNFPLQTDSM